jgi:hypothetical protein
LGDGAVDLRRTRLGGAVAIARPFPDKPPRSWRRTLERLRQKAATAEQQANQVLVDEFGLTATFPPVAGTAGAPPEADERGAMVLEHLRRLAFSDIGDFFDDGGQVKPIANVSPEARSALKAYITRADGSVTGVRLHNGLRALKRLAKHLGLR